MEGAGGVVRALGLHDRLHLAHQRVFDRVRDLGHDVRLRCGRSAPRCRRGKALPVPVAPTSPAAAVRA